MLLSAGASAGVHVVETKDVGPESARRVADLLARSLETGGQEAHVGHLVWTDCTEERACARELAASDRTDTVVLLRLFQTPSVLLVVAQRARGDGASVVSASAKLPRDGAWEAELERLARALFPDLSTRLTAETWPVVAPVRSDTPWLLYGGIGATVLLGVGIGFGASSRTARDRLLDGRSGPENIDPLRDRMQAHQTAANLFFGGALLTAGAAVLLEALE